MENINHSYKALRRAIGILGIALPVFLIIGNHGNIEKSISFFYYTKMSTVFTGVLIAFGLILFTYRGNSYGGSKLSENLLTNLGGLFALLVALIPTKSSAGDIYSLYSHNDFIRGWIHNGSAVLFIFFMGLIVLLHFGSAPYFKIYYKVLGTVVLLSLAFTIYAFINNDPEIPNAIFWGESISLWAFGIAWLLRGVPKGNIEARFPWLSIR